MAGKGFTDVRPELFTAAGAGAEPTGGQVAVTKPLKGGGTAMAAGAKELPLLLPPDVHADPELGWCVRLVPREGIMGQMAKLKRLREEDPTAAGELFSKAEQMVQLAAQGNLLSMKSILTEILAIPAWAGAPPLWHVARMIRAAAPEGHVSIVRWMVQGGGVRPRTVPPLADIVHLVVERTPPSMDGSPPQRTLDMISLLVTLGQFDPSVPRKSDGWTPLHVACARNLTHVSRHLIDLGADVNAVGNDDKMPLNLADRMAGMLFYRPPRRTRKEPGEDGDEDDEDEDDEEDQEDDDEEEEDEEEEDDDDEEVSPPPLPVAAARSTSPGTESSVQVDRGAREEPVPCSGKWRPSKVPSRQPWR